MISKLLYSSLFILASINKCENQEHTRASDNNTNNSNSVVVIDSSKNNVTSNWKTYYNEKYGFSFQYPDTWTKNGEESNAINLKGEIMSTSINFIDTVTQSVFSLEYSLPPNGYEVYKIEEEQYNTYKSSEELNIKKNIIAGNIAIESFATMSKDIKGNIYDPALKLIHTVFLDKQKTGAFNLNFRTPEPNSESEITEFKQIMSSFIFTNKSESK